jgi:enoyl-CoA hydratase/carnithine racemase
MSKSVLYEQDKRIVKITLNRPDTRNALSGDIIEELVEYLNKADKDKNVGCIILTGAGKSFSSGGNLQEIKDMTYQRQYVLIRIRGLVSIWNSKNS